MEIDKGSIIQFLERRSEHEAARRAADELPGAVDTHADRAALQRVGVDVGDLEREIATGTYGQIGEGLGPH